MLPAHCGLNPSSLTEFAIDNIDVIFNVILFNLVVVSAVLVNSALSKLSLCIFLGFETEKVPGALQMCALIYCFY